MNINNTHVTAVEIVLTIAALSRKSAPVVSSAQIGPALTLSRDYVSQVATPLVRAGFLRAVRGIKGGYALDVSLDVLTVADILRVCHQHKGEPACDTLCPALSEAFRMAQYAQFATLENYALKPMLASFKRKLTAMGVSKK